MSKFTIIVNTYPNPTRNKDLKKCLHSLISQTYQDFEILLIENFSDTADVEKTLFEFERYKNKISIITSPTKKLSFLFNLGWKSTKTEYVAFLADDAEADPKWLENINLELDEDPKVAVVSGPVISACYPAGEMHRLYLLSQKTLLFKLLAWPYLYFAAEGKIQKPGNLFESGAYSFGTSLKEAEGFERQEIDLATTTSMGIRKSVLEELGGFDENFSFNHADGDLFIRTKKLGYKIIFNPKVVAYHNVRIGPSRNAYIIGEDTGKFYRKDIRPKTLRGWVGACLNIKVLNAYWIYNFLRTGDVKQLQGITGFFKGFFSKIKIADAKSLNKKLNILFINRWVGYNEGGNETHIKDLMDQFSKRGHRVTVITTEGTALNYLKCQIKIEFVKGKQGYFSNEPRGILGALVFLVKCFVKFLQLYVNGESFDVLSVHFSLEAVLARFIKLFFGIPYVLVLAGDTSLELIEGRRADGKISISKFMNDQCKKYGYSAEIMPKGIDLQKFSPNIDFHALYEKEKLEGKFVVLTVARLDPRKNLITVIQAADELVNKKGAKDIVFYIIGDGVEKSMLEESITRFKLESYVKLLGSIQNSDPIFAKYYAMANVFVLPTLYEGFGWVFLEAMASGVPIITTRVGSNAEVVGDVGVVIEPKNPGLLAKAVLDTLNDKTLLGEMKKLGLEKAKSYSWENVMPKYEKYYAGVSKKKCNELGCKMGVLGESIVDFFEIVQILLKDRSGSDKSGNGSEWCGAGQEGLKV